MYHHDVHYNNHFYNCKKPALGIKTKQNTSIMQPLHRVPLPHFSTSNITTFMYSSATESPNDLANTLFVLSFSNCIAQYLS